MFVGLRFAYVFRYLFICICVEIKGSVQYVISMVYVRESIWLHWASSKFKLHLDKSACNNLFHCINCNKANHIFHCIFIQNAVKPFVSLKISIYFWLSGNVQTKWRCDCVFFRTLKSTKINSWHYVIQMALTKCLIVGMFITLSVCVHLIHFE